MRSFVKIVYITRCNMAERAGVRIADQLTRYSSSLVRIHLPQPPFTSTAIMQSAEHTPMGRGGYDTTGTPKPPAPPPKICEVDPLGDLWQDSNDGPEWSAGGGSLFATKARELSCASQSLRPEGSSFLPGAHSLTGSSMPSFALTNKPPSFRSPHSRA
jgi:hypothetical protein